MDKEEVEKKALGLERMQLIQWLKEEVANSKLMLEIIKKYEEYSNAKIDNEFVTKEYPLEQYTYIKENITAVVNGKEIKYYRCNEIK